MQLPTFSPAFSFAEALQASAAGIIDLPVLLAALERERSGGTIDAVLVAQVEQHEALHPLPPTVRNVLDAHFPVAPVADASALAPEEATEDLAQGVQAPMAPPRTAGPEGVRIAGRYSILQVLADGPRSRVYRAIDWQEANPSGIDVVAVKLLAGNATPHEDVLGAWRSRIEQVAALKHPGIVSYRDFGIDAGVAYLVTEYVQGRSLYELIQNNQVPQPRALLLLAKIADALGAAHAASVVHGDLKPGNILINASGAVKIIDFALPSVRALGGDSASTGVLTMTPGYASPQMLLHQPARAADDVYSFACIACELLTGQRPSGGESAQVLRTSVHHRPELTSAQYGAIQNGLEPDRSLRMPSMSQFMLELTRPQRARSRWNVVRWGVIALAVLIGALLLGRYGHRLPGPAAHAPIAIPAAGPRPGDTFQDCASCPPMRMLAPGEFIQGDNDSGSRFEKPQHRVRIAYPFAIATHAVTVEEFARFAEATHRPMAGCEVYSNVWALNPAASWRLPGFVQTGAHPITCVSWDDAVAYAAWMSSTSGHLYRLPSMSEWEFAARGGEAAATPWQNPQDACRHANVADRGAALKYPGWHVFDCEDQYVYTAPVGHYAANGFGLLDMLGNVFAWTQDCWHPDYEGTPADGTPRLEENCREHELRGGSWFSNPAYVRASYRNHFASDYRSSTVGLRLVREAGQ